MIFKKPFLFSNSKIEPNNFRLKFVDNRVFEKGLGLAFKLIAPKEEPWF